MCTRSIQVTKFVCIIKTERFASVKPYLCYLTKPKLTTASIVGSIVGYLLFIAYCIVEVIEYFIVSWHESNGGFTVFFPRIFQGYFRFFPLVLVVRPSVSVENNVVSRLRTNLKVSNVVLVIKTILYIFGRTHIGKHLQQYSWNWAGLG